MSDNRFHRQELFFGREGQASIRSVRVCIVGTGGTGSHVCQQLAFLGSEDFVLVERDIVTSTSRNRLIGSVSEDVTRKLPKVQAAKRMIQSISPGARVEPIEKSLLSQAGFEAVRSADFIFGCVDRDSVRHVLNELCQAYDRPYLDIATDVERQNPRNFGGRLVLSTKGNGCLYCRGELDERWIAQDFSSPGQRAEDDAIYGVDREKLGETGPSVVSLNGILASMAVTEFMAWATGLRNPAPHLIYRGVWGIVSVGEKPTRTDCYYCKGILGAGVNADVERYLRENWGTSL